MPEVTHHSKDMLESGFKLGSAGPWRLKWLLTEADGEGGQEGGWLCGASLALPAHRGSPSWAAAE